MKLEGKATKQLLQRLSPFLEPLATRNIDSKWYVILASVSLLTNLPTPQHSRESHLYQHVLTDSKRRVSLIATLACG
jgi:hypothetical protein